jgi:N-acetylneuraminate synthase
VDSDFSLEPRELTALVQESQRAWEALGSPVIRQTAGESESQRLRRSLYVVKPVKQGDVATAENVRSIRPAGGLAPAMYETVLGRTFRKDCDSGTPITWDIV